MAQKKAAAKISVVTETHSQSVKAPAQPAKNTGKYNPLEIPLAKLEEHTRLATGFGPIDLYTGGGFPHGAVVLVSGTEGSGKSTVATRAIAGFHRLYPKLDCLYLNAENKIDGHWAKRNGCDTARVKVVWPETTEEAQDTVRNAMRHRKDVGMIVVDSLAALCPKGEAEAEATDEQMAIAARINNKFFRQIGAVQAGLVKDGRPVTIVVINQERESLKRFGGVVLPGGKGQRYQAATWIRFLKSEVDLLANLNIPYRTLIRFTVVKNHEYGAGYPGEFYLHTLPVGPWQPGDVEDQRFVFKWAVQLAVLRKAGSKGFELAGEFGTTNDWITRWQADAAQYGTVKAALLAQYKLWQKGKAAIQADAAEDDDGTLAEGGTILGEDPAGEDAAGLG